MKRKCPNCKSKNTASALIYKRHKETREVIDIRQEWVCNNCDHMWEPGKRKVSP